MEEEWDLVSEEVWALVSVAVLHHGPSSVAVGEDCQGVVISSVEPPCRLWDRRIHRLPILLALNSAPGRTRIHSMEKGQAIQGQRPMVHK